MLQGDMTGCWGIGNRILVSQTARTVKSSEERSTGVASFACQMAGVDTSCRHCSLCGLVASHNSSSQLVRIAH